MPSHNYLARDSSKDINSISKRRSQMNLSEKDQDGAGREHDQEQTQGGHKAYDVGRSKRASEHDSRTDLSVDTRSENAFNIEREHHDGHQQNDSFEESAPPDIVAMIAIHSNRPTRARLLQLSRSTYILVAPILYERLVISKENAWKVFRGLARIRYPRRTNQGGIDKAQTAQNDDENAQLKNHQAFKIDPHMRKDDRPLGLYWPHVDLDSDDEHEEEDIRQAGSYPTHGSHKRKVALLRHVKYLTFASIPHRRALQHLEGWASNVHCATYYVRLFPRTEHLCVRFLAIYQLLDWHDRHTGFGPFQFVPFINALRICVAPKHCCITLPRLRSQYQAFAASRQRGYIGNPCVDGPNFMKSKIDIAWDRLSESLPSLMQNLVRSLAFETYTLHNFWTYGIPFFSPGIVSVFFGSCGCRSTSVSCIHRTGRMVPTEAVIELAQSVADERKSGRKGYRGDMITKTWQLISPPPGSVSDPAIEWSGIHAEVVERHPD